MRINLNAPTEQQSLFARAHYATITCRVCLLPAKVPIDAPAKLCLACRSDLVLTRNSQEAILDALDARTRAAFDAFDAAKASVTDEATLARWDRAEVAGVLPPKAFARSWATRGFDDDPITVLLLAWETFNAECEQIAQHRGRVLEALAEIEQAER